MVKPQLVHSKERQRRRRVADRPDRHWPAVSRRRALIHCSTAPRSRLPAPTPFGAARLLHARYAAPLHTQDWAHFTEGPPNIRTALNDADVAAICTACTRAAGRSSRSCSPALPPRWRLAGRSAAMSCGTSAGSCPATSWRRPDIGLPGLLASRPLLEGHLRAMVRRLPGVGFLEDRSVAGGRSGTRRYKGMVKRAGSRHAEI